MPMVLSLIRRFVPKPVFGAYHFVLALIAAAVYRHPSEKLIVVGVTGTNGKSSTVQFIGRILEHTGRRVGWTTTVGFKIAEREWVNDKKMTMLGRFQTQRFLRQMVDAGCAVAIIETSSQGIAQSRHVGIHYDIAVFTNLTPEHIEAHGGFEAYKAAKGKLFAALARAKEKTIHGTPVKKASVVNVLDEHAAYVLSFGAGQAYPFGKQATDVVMNKNGTTFSIADTAFHFKPIGRFNFENVLAAITTCQALGLTLRDIADGVSRLEPVPGRLEVIDEGQSFTVIVDYAPEPAALNATYEALALIGGRRLIHVLGSTGGGRDVARRRVLGQMAAGHAAIVIVTNEDPYDDDPSAIIEDVAAGAREHGKRDGIDLFALLDRQEAVNKAMAIAQEGDIVLMTGKGSEPVMAVAHGRKIPWDDRAAARKALHHL
ncbi:UDP-N-acetylmuramyl-tripeptide synthetase [Candidatus Uhrbacteria bacterium]|nr:UDP-N-acetylmuramyl-tripeptide synthetase [Candidatus Uhrbacteria bacterium]